MPEIRLRGGEVDGLGLHYVVEGRGPAVVLVHGLGGFAESWRHNVAPLTRQATVYALDLPGFGTSAKPRAQYRLAYFALALHGFFEALGLRQASLVGHSLGAGVCVTYALTHPTRVDRLALIGGVVPGFSFRPPWIYPLLALPGVGDALSLLGSAGPSRRRWRAASIAPCARKWTSSWTTPTRRGPRPTRATRTWRRSATCARTSRRAATTTGARSPRSICRSS